MFKKNGTSSVFQIMKGELQNICFKKVRCAPSTDEWISEMCCIHTMDYYWALKSKEILPHATLKALC